MFKTIIWATDGSAAAERALEFAKGLVAYEHGQLIAVHANQLLGGRAGGHPVSADEEDIELRILREVDELRDQGVDASFKLLKSARHDAGRLIADYAAEAGADAIVVGTRGHSPLTNMVVGSVTHRLLHLAPCPVLAIPPLTRSETSEKRDARVAVS